MYSSDHFREAVRLTWLGELGGGHPLAQLVEQASHLQRVVLTAAALGSSSGLGPFAVCHLPLSCPHLSEAVVSII